MQKQSLTTAIAIAAFCQVASANLVITEIMQNPSAVLDSAGEWFEVFNSGPVTIDLNGFTFEDDGSNSFTVNSSLISSPGSYLVFGRNGNVNTNGGVAIDYVYSGFDLANGDDEIVLLDASSIELDRVEYDGGPAFPDPTGASMSLVGTDPGIDNNLGSSWAEATIAYGDGDLGTPGSGSFAFTTAAVPEPTAALFGSLIAGAMGVTVARRRRSED